MGYLVTIAVFAVFVWITRVGIRRQIPSLVVAGGFGLLGSVLMAYSTVTGSDALFPFVMGGLIASFVLIIICGINVIRR